MNKEIGAIVLCRYASVRLPGKILLQIGGKTVLQHIIDRLSDCLPKRKILIATSTDPSDDPIAAFADKLSVTCYRGSLDRVAWRFHSAALSRGWDYAIRINGDNIFVDTATLSGMINVAMNGEYDFISNVHQRTFPKGMSIEIVRVPFYEKSLGGIGTNPEYLEHVTKHLYEQESDRYCYVYNREVPGAAGIQLALDDEDDLVRTTLIVNHFGDRKNGLKEIYEYYKTL